MSSKKQKIKATVPDRFPEVLGVYNGDTLLGTADIVRHTIEAKGVKLSMEFNYDNERAKFTLAEVLDDIFLPVLRGFGFQEGTIEKYIIVEQVTHDNFSE